MVWDGENKSKVFYGGRLVLEKDGELTAEDIYRLKAELNLGTIDVIDMETGRSLQPADFPRVADVKLVPIVKAGHQ